MRYHEILSEMPLDSYDVHGDFSQAGSHTPKDRKLLASPRHPERMTKLLRAGPYKIAVHVANIDRSTLANIGHQGPPDETYAGPPMDDLALFNELGGELNEISGEYSPAELAQFGLQISAKPDCINFVVAGNAAGEHSLSAWMVMHRLTHMVEDAADNKHRLSPELIQTWRQFAIFCSKSILSPGGGFMATIEELATMKSALNDANVEAANEFLVQYWVKGHCPLRRDKGLPEDRLVQIEQAIDGFCKSISDLMVGRIYFSF